MTKNKLAKFADMASYPHVFEAPVGHEPPADFALRGRWRDDFFHTPHPLVLELGCGRGEYTVGMARLFPEKNFVGVDIKGSRMWTGATEALREGLANAAFLRTRIEFIDRYFAPGEVDEIWLTFSDPQMRKATKRLTSTHFLERYRHILRPGGLVHLKTDSNFLFTYTRLMAEHNALPVVALTADLHAAPLPRADAELQRVLGIRTYYEQQWTERGIAIKYISFRLPSEGQLAEPDVEIEVDDYRSYNRSKRSALERAK